MNINAYEGSWVLIGIRISSSPAIPCSASIFFFFSIKQIQIDADDGYLQTRDRYN